MDHNHPEGLRTITTRRDAPLGRNLEEEKEGICAAAQLDTSISDLREEKAEPKASPGGKKLAKTKRVPTAKTPKCKSTFAEDWTPAERTVEWAIALTGVDREKILVEAEICRDNSRAKALKYIDFETAFKNWIRIGHRKGWGTFAKEKPAAEKPHWAKSEDEKREALMEAYKREEERRNDPVRIAAEREEHEKYLAREAEREAARRKRREEEAEAEAKWQAEMAELDGKLPTYAIDEPIPFPLPIARAEGADMEMELV